ncbi:phospholipase D-like domain-containing protein [Sphingorhabdus lutea]|uniref:phospholipase D-like domain-containing protein n=1 Tax=Sphingorhabdus lutea TaxID=1913578 RepID=UPI0018DE438B|nr:phosphatidylserine/phosphatidylglycerophosphate/cardiolipin synthase family protein [Sphingorhabdus lutea]
MAEHDLVILLDAEARLNAYCAMIKKAQNSIHIIIYMIADDETGNEVKAALIAALNRGISCSMIVDSFGSAELPDSFFDDYRKAGGKISYFSARWSLHYLVRNHQKLLIIDGQHCLVGGYNLTNNYVGRSGENSWEDLGLIISGPKVRPMQDYFYQLGDVNKGGKISFRALRQLLNNWPMDDEDISWHIGGPKNRLSPWAKSVKSDLETENSLMLVMAYFSPSQAFVRRIAKIAKRGNATLLLAGKTDNKATMAASRLLYKYLLKRQAKIYEYQKLPLHMKLMVFDNHIYIGSSNMDIRSLFINMEIMLRVRDKQVADFMRSFIEDKIKDSEEITLSMHKSRHNYLARIHSSFAYFLVNVVDYTLGSRIKIGQIKTGFLSRWARLRRNDADQISDMKNEE